VREYDVVAAIREVFAAHHALGEDADDDASRIDDLLASHACTDVIVEGVDFDRALSPVRFAGHKALAQNLSDLYACDCEPSAFLWALSIPPSWSLDDVRAFSRGAASLAGALGVRLIGGDLSSTSGPFQCAITALGRAPGMSLGRRGARAGQSLWLTRPVGGAAAGLRVLMRDRPGDDEVAFARWRAGLAPAERRAVDCQLTPSPVHELERLSDVAVAAIDVSDGLLTDVGRLAHASGLAAAIDGSAISGAVDTAAGATREDALIGGEDYAFVLAVPDGLEPATGVRIGGLVAGAAGEVRLDGHVFVDAGFDHFAARPNRDR